MNPSLPPALHIAVVDDEVDITRLLAAYLEGQGYRVTQLHSGRALAELMPRDPPALVLLDLGLPGEDGFAVARQLREHWRCGLVIVTGRGDAVDKIVGLEVGADDYVTKPFDLRELVARMKAVLRRLQPTPQPAAAGAGRPRIGAAAAADRERLSFEGWQLDLAARRLTDPGGSEVGLTTGEFELLRAFVQQPGRVLSRDALLEQTRGREAAPFDRTIDVQVGRLRRKLEVDAENPQIIKSVRGAGYIFIPPVSAAAGTAGGALSMAFKRPAALPAGVDENTVFRSLFAAYPDALLLVDAAGQIVMANPAAEALLGYAAGTLAGIGVEALVPDAIRPRHAAYRQAYGTAPRTRPMGTQMDLVARRRDGTEVMVEIALSPLQEQGLPFVVAAIRDIGSYPRVKQALQRARYSEHLAQLGRLAVGHARPAAVCCSRCRRSRRRRWRSTSRRSSCSRGTSWSCASPAASA